MTETAQSYQTMRVRQLYDHMERFASDNDHSNDVDTRWLAKKVLEFLPTVGNVMNSRLAPEMRTEINAFRAAEIATELEAKRRDVDRLERTLQQLRA